MACKGCPGPAECDCYLYFQEKIDDLELAVINLTAFLQNMGKVLDTIHLGALRLQLDDLDMKHKWIPREIINELEFQQGAVEYLLSKQKSKPEKKTPIYKGLSS